MSDRVSALNRVAFTGIAEIAETGLQGMITLRGDLASAAVKKAATAAAGTSMPGRGEAGEYGEITSTSNCTDFQARRLKIRFKRAGEKKKNELVHTLNGTAVSNARAIVAISRDPERRASHR